MPGARTWHDHAIYDRLPLQRRLVLSYQAHLPAFLHSMFHVGVYHAVALVSFSELPRAPQSLETRRSARYLRSSPGGFLQMGIAPRAVPSIPKPDINYLKPPKESNEVKQLPPPPAAPYKVAPATGRPQRRRARTPARPVQSLRPRFSSYSSFQRAVTPAPLTRLPYDHTHGFPTLGLPNGRVTA